MTTVSTTVREIHDGTETVRVRGVVRVLSVGVSSIMLMVTLLVWTQGRTDLQRNQSWIEMAQGQLRQVQGEVARAQSDRTATLITRNRRTMAAELPVILRKIPTDVPTQQIIATADVWRIVHQKTSGTTGTEDLVFPRPSVGEQSDAAYLGE
jgi:type II secretory pathway pseudopilin PulG